MPCQRVVPLGRSMDGMNNQETCFVVLYEKTRGICNLVFICSSMHLSIPININKSRFEVEVSVLCTFLIIYPVHGHRFSKSPVVYFIAQEEP